MKSPWQLVDGVWWLRDFTTIPDPSGLHTRALRGRWQHAPYETRHFSGRMILANPSQGAPDLRIPLPVRGRHSIAFGLATNYCDRVLVKLARDRCFVHMGHSPVSGATQAIEECWWRDADLAEGDELVIRQDAAMKRRCGVAFVRVAPAASPTRGEIPLLATADGGPGNDGPVDLHEMMACELQFADTHVTDILHGTDINGQAQYMTKLASHRYPTERVAEEVQPDNEYYPWLVGQMLKYEREGRCPLRDSIAAAHDIGRKLFAYHRMAVTRLFAPFRSLFECPFYDEHPEWRCLDFDGTPVSRLSMAFPGVRQFMLEHFRETIEFGADGLCLVFSRGWPLVLFEQPVADEFKRRTGKEMRAVKPDDPDLRQVRADFITAFVREIRGTMLDAAKGRETTIVALTLAQPSINRCFGMDCDVWARDGLVRTFCPYPYGLTAVSTPIPIPEWRDALRGTPAKLCPTLQPMAREPGGAPETPVEMLDRAERWLVEGADGFMVWDLDSKLSNPFFRALASNIGSAEGRSRLRKIADRGPILHELKTVDGLAVDRYHPGWNV